MKVAIIVPRSTNKKQMYSEYPLGVGYIGTIIFNLGHNVKIYDQNVEYTKNEELVNEIIRFSPDLICFSILTPTYPITLEIINILKKKNISTPILAGGIHPTLFPIDCLNEGIDYVIKGEGEIPIEKFIYYMEGKEEIFNIPNLSYKDKNGVIVNKPNEKLDIDINKLPFINRDLFNIKKYKMHSISGSRGCQFNCKFCCNYSHLSNIAVNKRIRSVENIIEEIKYLCENYEKKDIFFTDDVFFIDINKLRRFEKLIRKNNLNIRFNAQLRVNMINDEVCQLLIKSGCKKVEVGIETGSEKILKDVCKGITVEDIERGIKICKRNNLRIKTNWIYGLPGDLEEQYKSIELMLKTKPNEISIHQLVPFPGTKYYNNREKYGIIINSCKDFKNFYYGNSDESIIYKYMSKEEYHKLIYDTIIKLEEAGYKSSDNSKNGDEYIYTTPFDKLSLQPISVKEEKECIQLPLKDIMELEKQQLQKH